MDFFRQVENLVHRYAEMIDGGDFDGLGGLFARGSVHFVPGGLSIHGAKEVTRFYEKSIVIDGATGTPGTVHWVSNLIIQGDAEGLLSRSRYRVTLNVGGEPPRLIATGRYFDHFFIEDSQVYFSQRRVVSEYIGDTSGHLRQGLFTVAANGSEHDVRRR